MPNYIRQDSAETRESKIGMTRYRNLDEVKTRVGQTPEDNTVFNVFVNDGDAESAFGVSVAWYALEGEGCTDRNCHHR